MGPCSLKHTINVEYNSAVYFVYIVCTLSDKRVHGVKKNWKEKQNVWFSFITLTEQIIILIIILHDTRNSNILLKRNQSTINL